MAQSVDINSQPLINRLQSKVFFLDLNTDDLEIIGVIRFSIGHPTKDKVHGVISSYRNASNKLHGAYLSNQLIGVIGFEQTEQKINIRHISVLPEFRGLGVGTLLLNHIRTQCEECKIIAETDMDSVGFYQKSGFACNPFQGKHGNLRYSCESTT